MCSVNMCRIELSVRDCVRIIPINTDIQDQIVINADYIVEKVFMWGSN